MKAHTTHRIDPQREKKLHARLREHPELFERIEAIVSLAEAGGEDLNADQIEERLVEEVCKLGHETLECWAAGAEKQAADDLCSQKPGIRERKKNG